jgi:hypothetical protein
VNSGLSTEAIYQAIYRSGSEIRRPQRATLLRAGRDPPG